MQLFLFIFFVQSYRTWYNINQDSQSLSLPSFSFQAGGIFNISFTKAAADYVYVGLCNTNEFKMVKSISNIDDSLCLNFNNNAQFSVKHSEIVKIENLEGTYNGNISDSGVYKTVFFTCGQTFSKYDILLTFQNPLSNLSADIQPLLYEKPVLLIFITIIMILWVSNWIRFFSKFTLKNYLHLMITFSLFLNFISVMTYYIEIYVASRYETYTNLVISYSKIVVHSIFEVTLFSTLLLAGKGWSIVFEKLSNSNVIISISFSFLTILTQSLLNYLDINFVNQWEIPLIIIAVFFVSLYIRELVNGIQNATDNIIAHMYVIAKSGIDSTTTPIFYKFKMLSSLTYSLFTYFVLKTLIISIKHLTYIDFWIIELVSDILNIAIIGNAAWFFKLSNPKMKDYTMLECNASFEESDEIKEEEKEEIVYLEDIEYLNKKSEKLSKGLLIWEIGTKLPKQPFLKMKESEIKKKQVSKKKENNDDLKDQLIDSPKVTV
ncbi:hypothetical protein TRFO_28238 [Tritrichomonas foetus]|uniref:GPR180/TMEM145 transmembrane domain-containing protein n=1 Tax=Tritrichomonas foetus TaxID=1144522 RepID=A0A1J4K029_9EUKA|nr:hypothetical protein TRFO_28238 [Tritrichomonas foetus]|eukprot:OHT04298.1 hypothetical protein TRFO_28238 [Tritrichomonas foetus]